MQWVLSKLRGSSLRSAKGKSSVICALLAIFASPAGMFPAAAQGQSACEQFNWSIKREQAAFASADLKTVPSGATLETLPEKGVAIELKPNSTVAYVLPPARQPRKSDTSGGIISVSNIPKAGTYQVTASSDAWIDVIQNGKALDSTAHTGRRECADVRKSVRFDLQPGSATIQLSGADTNVIKIAILPAE